MNASLCYARRMGGSQTAPTTNSRSFGILTAVRRRMQRHGGIVRPIDSLRGGLLHYDGRDCPACAGSLGVYMSLSRAIIKDGAVVSARNQGTLHHMDISVFGLGYVGAVSGACLAEMGHRVTGVDVDEFKVATINKGESPIVEVLISELTQEMAASGQFRATTDAGEAIRTTEMSLICVGTPSTAAGGLETSYVRRVSEEIGDALRDKTDYHLVVVRSTVLPGTVHGVVVPALEAHSGKTIGEDIGLCFHPEFLREGTSVEDFRKPPKIVIGATDEKAGKLLAGLYEDFEAPLFITGVGAAEMVKYADNCFHALKVVFGNEIGTLCKVQGIDSYEVMRIFREDRKLNISPAYLMPGFAYGGSCLPKDLRALNYQAQSQHVEMPVLANIQRSNDAHVQRALEMILDLGKRSIGLLGLSFKRGTDDLRESPLVELTERLLGKGCQVRIYDENVLLARLRGGNKAYVEQRLPHIAELLMDDPGELADVSDVIVLGANSPAFADILDERGAGKLIVDLVRLYEGGADRRTERFAGYLGVCW